MKFNYLDIMTCFICRDQPNVLYKLCDCESSTICVECYNLELVCEMTNCAICRKKYKIIRKRNYLQSLKIVCHSLIRNCVYPISDLIIPTYIYLKRGISLLYIFIIAYCIFFINVTNIQLIKLFNQNENDTKKFIYIFNSLKYCLTALMLIYIFFERDSQQKINKLLLSYEIMVLVPGYLLPFSIFNSYLIIKNIVRYIKKVNRITIKKAIKIKSIIYQDNINESTV